MTANAPIEFVKMTGSGNDFIVIDNRKRVIDPATAPEWVKSVCRRALSVGADGVILIENDPQGEVDFAWRFFNSDGSEAEMCGNGGRCAVRYAHDIGLADGAAMVFRTAVGLIHGWMLGERDMRVGLTQPTGYRAAVEVPLPEGAATVAYIDTGVPHAVWSVENVHELNVGVLGRQVRQSPVFAPRGANVNFVEVTGPHEATIRTYERGVEDETLACGTGCAAAAIALGLEGKVTLPVRLKTRGGDVLTVDYRVENGQVVDLTFQGPVRYVARGVIDPESWS
jgi:diaminopimelate epimerase